MRARKTTLAAEEAEILVAVLAKGDAAHLPIRNWRAPNPGSVYTARRRFRAVGIPWESGGVDACERQRLSRALAALKRAKLVGVHRVRGSRYPSVKLTDVGDQRARALCGLPGPSFGWATVHRVAELTKPPGKARLLTDVWLSEAALCNAPAAVGYPVGTELSLVESLALPAIVRGWLAVGSDIAGRASYAVTRAGRRVLDARPPDNDDVALAAVDRQARAAYRESLLAELDRLATAAAECSREIGSCPLPVSVDGLALLGVWTPDTA